MFSTFCELKNKIMNTGKEEKISELKRLKLELKILKAEIKIAEAKTEVLSYCLQEDTDQVKNDLNALNKEEGEEIYKSFLSIIGSNGNILYSGEASDYEAMHLDHLNRMISYETSTLSTAQMYKESIISSVDCLASNMNDHQKKIVESQLRKYIGETAPCYGLEVAQSLLDIIVVSEQEEPDLIGEVVDVFGSLQ